MLKKTVTYVDYENTERTEDFYFNLSQAEVTEMELSIDGGLVKKIERIVAAKNGAEIMKLFKEIVLKSFGVKSPDGRKFIKSQELSEDFSFTEAYSQIFMSLVTDPDAAAAFVRGIVPNTK